MRIMTSISDSVLTATKQSCGDTRLRRHEVAKTRGCDSTERKITYKLLSEKRNKRNETYNNEYGKITRYLQNCGDNNTIIL